LADMGRQTDERLERVDAFEDSTVHVEPAETLEEEDELTDALAHIGALTSTQHDPFHLYQREAQRHRLLSAEEEIEIGQTMEASLELALDALAAWPDGVSRLLGAAKAVQVGKVPMRWLCAGPRQDPPLIQDSDVAIDVAPVAAAPESEPPASGAEEDADDDASSGARSETPDADFFSAAELLSGVVIDPDRNSPAWSEARSLLTTMRIASSFLLELTDEAILDKSDVASDFRQAMAMHRRDRDRMAIGNLKLVLFQAKKYLYSGVPLGDLVQAGNIGLLRAVDKFDWRRGFRFSTFATWWVRQGISRFVAEKSRTIRLPVHVFEELQRLIRESEVFEKQMGRAPEPSDIAARLGLAERKVAALLIMALEPLSLSEIDIDKRVEPSMADEHIARDPMEIVEDRQLEEAINAALTCLAFKDERIIRQRFGLGGLAEHTLDEIGIAMGVTRERIRQIESKALARLRHPSRAGLLDPSKGRPRVEGLEAAAETVDSEGNKPTPTNPIEDWVINGPFRMVPVAVNQALRLAESMNAPVEDDRLGSSGKIWVRTDDEYTHTSILIPRLVELGFAHEAGKGYWR
jgi:RNA polymerase primary sigma factor